DELTAREPRRDVRVEVLRKHRRVTRARHHETLVAGTDGAGGVYHPTALNSYTTPLDSRRSGSGNDRCDHRPERSDRADKPAGGTKPASHLFPFSPRGIEGRKFIAAGAVNVSGSVNLVSAAK